MFDFEENVWYVLEDPKGLAKQPFCKTLSQMIMSFGGKIKPIKVKNGCCYSFEYSNGLISTHNYIPKELSVYFKRVFPTGDCVAIDIPKPLNDAPQMAEIIQFPKIIPSIKKQMIAC